MRFCQKLKQYMPDEKSEAERYRFMMRNWDGVPYEAMPYVHQKTILSPHPKQLQRLNLITFLLGNGNGYYVITDLFARMPGWTFDNAAIQQIRYLAAGKMLKYKYYDLHHKRYMPLEESYVPENVPEKLLK